jgi:hypothetical protein
LVFCRQLLIPQQEFLIDRSGEATTRAQDILDSPSIQPRKGEIADAVSQSQKSIRGEPVESFKLLYFNSFENFDHTRAGAIEQFAGVTLDTMRKGWNPTCLLTTILGPPHSAHATQHQACLSPLHTLNRKV